MLTLLLATLYSLTLFHRDRMSFQPFLHTTAAKSLTCQVEESSQWRGNWSERIKKWPSTPTFPSIYLGYVRIYKSTSERASSTLSMSRLLLIESKHQKNAHRRRTGQRLSTNAPRTFRCVSIKQASPSMYNFIPSVLSNVFRGAVENHWPAKNHQDISTTHPPLLRRLRCV